MHGTAQDNWNPSYSSLSWQDDAYAAAGWTGQGWQEDAFKQKKKHKPRSQSRDRQHPATPSAKAGNGKGKHKGKGGRGKPKGEPAWNAPQAPQQPTPAPTTPPAATQDQALLRSLLTALKKQPDNMSSEVQQIMQDAAIMNSQNSTKQMFGAVKEFGKAQQALEQAIAARRILHAAWRDFIVEAVARWKQFAQDFTEEDGKLAKQVTDAQSSFQAAKKQLSSSKTAAGVKAEAEIVESSAEEEMESDKIVQEGMLFMTNTLNSLCSKAEEMVEADLRDQKRRRKVADRDAKAATGPEDGQSSSHFT